MFFLFFSSLQLHPGNVDVQMNNVSWQIPYRQIRHIKKLVPIDLIQSNGFHWLNLVYQGAETVGTGTCWYRGHLSRDQACPACYKVPTHGVLWVLGYLGKIVLSNALML